MKVSGHNTELVPTFEKDGEKYPFDLTKNGWLFDPSYGDQIVGKYLFGTTMEVSKNDLIFEIAESQADETNIDSIKPNDNSAKIDYNSIYILVGIGAAAAVAIFLYIKKPKKQD
jgi:hypothetical protein